MVFKKILEDLFLQKELDEEHIILQRLCEMSIIKVIDNITENIVNNDHKSIENVKRILNDYRQINENPKLTLKFLINKEIESNPTSKSILENLKSKELDKMFWNKVEKLDAIFK